MYVYVYIYIYVDAVHVKVSEINRDDEAPD